MDSFFLNLKKKSVENAVFHCTFGHNELANVFKTQRIRLICADLTKADLMGANESYGINGMQIFADDGIRLIITIQKAITNVIINRRLKMKRIDLVRF